jgi:hypothetical protein
MRSKRQECTHGLVAISRLLTSVFVIGLCLPQGVQHVGAQAAPPNPDGLVGRWAGSLPGLPNSKLASVPTLGNGYLGLVLGTGRSGPASIDFWVNSELNLANSCATRPKPVARCTQQGPRTSCHGLHCACLVSTPLASRACPCC